MCVCVLREGSIAANNPSSVSLHSSALYGSSISHRLPSTPNVSDFKSKVRNCWRTVILNTNNVVSSKKSADLARLRTDYTMLDALNVGNVENIK